MKPKRVGSNERLASPKPCKPRSCLRWSPTGRLFDLKGKIIASSEFENQSDFSNGDNACTSNPLEPTIKRFPNSTSFLGRLSKFFLGTVRFGNDHVAAILGFDDLQWGNILITRVYFVEGLGHNLFSVGQFCDSDLEVAFRRNICFVRNLEGVDLIKGNRTTNLYTINLHEMASTSPICLMACATSTKSWLWHQRLSHLNFETINDLAKNNIVTGLSKFKYHKEHLCPLCEQGKSKRASHPPKLVPNSKQRSKDEAPEVIKTFLKRINVLLQSPVIIIRTDNGTEFKNQILKKYGMESYPVGTPMEIKDKFDLDQNGSSVDATKYRSMISALMYLMSSKPNIVHATCLCARYQAKPTEKHLKEVKRIFRYLRGTVNMGLWYTKDSGFELTGFSYADYVGCKDTFKSTSGRAQFLGEKLEHVEKGTIELYFVKTDYQLADLFTKSLLVDRFNYLVYHLGMRSLSPQELDRLAKL
ncbi:retrovirus-related pol polyprotein from transposon TNT 1-94 [Tanacetum coccineum]